MPIPGIELINSGTQPRIGAHTRSQRVEPGFGALHCGQCHHSTGSYPGCTLMLIQRTDTGHYPERARAVKIQTRKCALLPVLGQPRPSAVRKTKVPGPAGESGPVRGRLIGVSSKNKPLSLNPTHN